MPRLFVSLEIPSSVRTELAALRTAVPGARWLPEEQYHLTLAFLGEVDGPTALAVQEGLHGVRHDPFELTLSGVGHFPPKGRPRVLWAGVEDAADAAEVSSLAKAVQRCLKRRGLRFEARKFAPHVTLARLRDTPFAPVLGFVEAFATWRSEPFPVTDFALFSSVLGRSGAQHSEEASYPLMPLGPA